MKNDILLPLRVRIKKDQAFEPGFLFLGKSVELAPKDLDKNKKRGARSAPVFFMTSFGRDSPPGNSHVRTGLAARQFPPS